MGSQGPVARASRPKRTAVHRKKNVEKGTRQEGLPCQAAESAKIPAQVLEGEQGSPTGSGKQLKDYGSRDR